MRIGYAIGNSELIKAMSDVKYSINSYTLNQVSLKSGVAAIEDEAYFKETVNKIVATRERVKKEIKKLTMILKLILIMNLFIIKNNNFK